MALIADSGAIYGLYDRRDVAHSRLRMVIEQERTPIVIPTTSLGEIDYLLRSRLGNRALIQFLADVDAGSFRVECVTEADLARCRGLIAKFSDLDLGLSDAAVAVVADRLNTDRILTVDQRDFQLLRTARGKRFRLLP
jgi:predicted nucleic acid-binding protein